MKVVGGKNRIEAAAGNRAPEEPVGPDAQPDRFKDALLPQLLERFERTALREDLVDVRILAGVVYVDDVQPITEKTRQALFE